MNRYYYPRYANSRRPPHYPKSSINSNKIDTLAVNKNSSVFGANKESSRKNPDPELEQQKTQVTKLNIDKPILEFHGIQIYQDDLLILMLLFFLYKENVNDGLLYMTLLALLVL